MAGFLSCSRIYAILVKPILEANLRGYWQVVLLAVEIKHIAEKIYRHRVWSFFLPMLGLHKIVSLSRKLTIGVCGMGTVIGIGERTGGPSWWWMCGWGWGIGDPWLSESHADVLASSCFPLTSFILAIDQVLSMITPPTHTHQTPWMKTTFLQQKHKCMIWVPKGTALVNINT